MPFRDFLVVKYFVSKKLKKAIPIEAIKTQTMYKIKPGSACLPEKPFSPRSKKKNKKTPTMPFIKAVIKNAAILILKIYENSWL